MINSCVNDLRFRVFERYPEARALFSRVKGDEPNSPEYRAHLMRIDNAIDIMVNLMEDPAVLYEEIKHLTQQHVAREGMKAAYMTVSFLIVSSPNSQTRSNHCEDLFPFSLCWR